MVIIYYNCQPITGLVEEETFSLEGWLLSLYLLSYTTGHAFFTGSG